MTTESKINASGVPGDRSAPGRMTVLDPATHDSVMINHRGDRFITQVTEAVAACASQALRDEIASKGRNDSVEFIGMVNEFCAKHQSITLGIIGIEYTGMVCEFITSGQERDYEIADIMGDFALEVFDKFPEFKVAFHTFPASTCDESELSNSESRAIVYNAEL